MGQRTLCPSTPLWDRVDARDEWTGQSVRGDDTTVSELLLAMHRLFSGTTFVYSWSAKMVLEPPLRKVGSQNFDTIRPMNG